MILFHGSQTSTYNGIQGPEAPELHNIENQFTFYTSYMWKVNAALPCPLQRPRLKEQSPS